MFASSLSGTSGDCGLGRLGGNSKVELGKRCLETLGELSKALDLGILHGFLAVVLDFGNLKSSLDDLLLGAYGYRGRYIRCYGYGL